VSIWYDHGGYTATKSPWRALELNKIEGGPTVLHENESHKVFRNTFTGSLPTPFPDDGKTYKGRKFAFTVRYRINRDSEWTWVHDNFGHRDGELILQPPVDPNFLAASPVELQKGWNLRKLTSEAPEARLYAIESSSPIPSNGNNSKFEAKVLGRITQISRWFALVRIWEPWLAPRHGEHHFHLSEPAILCSFLRSDGLHVVLLAINGIDEALTVFHSTPEGDIVVSTRNDTGADRKFRILAATSWSFEVANSAVMYEARKLVRLSSAYQESVGRLPSHIKSNSIDSDTVLISKTVGAQDDAAPAPQWLESWYDSLAYCTWNSLGQDLNADKIMAGLESLAKNKIHIATLIIDDNWQSLDGKQGETNQFQRGWKEFEANPLGFPQGLKAAVAKIREVHPHIKDVAVWHALMGYWGGISHDGEIAKKYKTREINLRQGSPAAGLKLAVDPEDIHRMYNDFYSFLSDCGVSGVKCGKCPIKSCGYLGIYQSSTIPTTSQLWLLQFVQHIGTTTASFFLFFLFNRVQGLY